MPGYCTYDRDVLYEQVWAEPVKAVAKRYGISDVALAKICRRLRVPVPGRGYWQQIEAGQQLPKATLGRLPDGVQTKLYARRGRREVVELTAEAEALASREKDPAAAIVVPEKLETPHTLVSTSAKILGKCAADDSGVVSCRDRKCLSICVAPPNLDRALRVMNALIIALEKRSLTVEIADVSERERVRGQMEPRSVYATRVLVDEEWIEFSLHEERPGVELPPPPPPKALRGEQLVRWQSSWSNRPRRAYVPNGTLVLRIDNGPMGSRQSWSDGKRQRIEGCLNAFVAQLYVAAKAVKQRRAEQEQREREREEARRWQAEEQERARREKALEEKLEVLISGWRRAREIREFVAALSKAIARQGAAADARIIAFVERAKEHADAIDPLTDVTALFDEDDDYDSLFD